MIDRNSGVQKAACDLDIREQVSLLVPLIRLILPAESFVPVPVIPGSPELVTKGFFWKPFTNVILRVCYIDM
jgi:hypothetical protein